MAHTEVKDEIDGLIGKKPIVYYDITKGSDFNIDYYPTPGRGRGGKGRGSQDNQGNRGNKRRGEQRWK